MKVHIIAYSIIIIGLLSLFMQDQYLTDLTEEDHYCSMVERGAWPDYKGTYDAVCRDGRSVALLSYLEERLPDGGTNHK